ncbi:MAG: CDP-diacylglycerol--glycerol-3-phosphate 3-phosphatidyltransferase [Gammaproteobacteria bacterium]|nr:CDP-diacylglycerol--glycerol-3-phosphate 3-phosphatidyltransferase [Gammaproteobacteria bacterium]
MTTPTLLTLVRIGLIPVLALFFYLPWELSRPVTALIFTLASITDWLDGYLARKLNQTSAFGAFLDPVADKLMVAVALVLLVQASPTPWLAIPAAVIIGREIAVSALRERMAELGKGGDVAVSMIGKIKTGSQMVAIILLLYQDSVLGFPVEMAGYVLVYVAASLTLWSMVVYLTRAWPTLYGSGRDR